jgi:hypothetical protein
VEEITDRVHRFIGGLVDSDARDGNDLGRITGAR